MQERNGYKRRVDEKDFEIIQKRQHAEMIQY